MARLGQLLELLHNAAECARPARLTVVEWRHGPRSQRAFERFMRRRHGDGRVGQTMLAQGEPAPDETRWTTTLALESPTRFREDAAGAQAGKRYVVRDGERWVSWDEDWGATTNESDEGAPSAQYGLLLDPVGLTTAFRLDPLDTVRVADREGLAALATPRRSSDGGDVFALRIGAGADTVELTIDAERGALLRAAALVDGEPFQRLEVTELAFGPIPPAVFEPSLPPGVEPSARWPRPERLPLHELSAAAPFTVLVPDLLPEGWRLLESLLTPGREKPPLEPEVFLSYGSRDGAYLVSISARAAQSPRRGWLAWEWDGEFEAADAGEHVEPRHHVRVVRGGTIVELSGADAPLLRDLARTLVPAPTEPPRLGG